MEYLKVINDRKEKSGKSVQACENAGWGVTILNGEKNIGLIVRWHLSKGLEVARE